MKKRAIIFPGQGAQQVGMGQSFLADLELKPLFEEASDVLGWDLAKVCVEGPQEELTKSDKAQPAIFVVSIAALKALQKKSDVSFDAVAGLSSGEWAALNAADVVSYSDTLKILEARGRLMQAACESKPGGMISIIGLNMDQLKEVADQAGIEIANINSAVQVVLSGSKEGVEKAEPIAKAMGAKRAIILPVAGAFHSSLMQEAADAFAETLEGITFNNPRVPVLSNVSGQIHTDVAGIAASMVRQITSSVQWVANVEAMQATGVTEYIECGPGKVLTGLIKRIDKEASTHNIQTMEDADAVATVL